MNASAAEILNITSEIISPIQQFLVAAVSYLHGFIKILFQYIQCTADIVQKTYFGVI
jgi:hypothetical protein